MTIKATFAAIRALGLTASRNPDTRDYRVTYTKVDAAVMGTTPEDAAHYTNDADDAIGTANAMARALKAAVASQTTPDCKQDAPVYEWGIPALAAALEAIKAIGVTPHDLAAYSTALDLVEQAKGDGTNMTEFWPIVRQAQIDESRDFALEDASLVEGMLEAMGHI